MSFSLCLPLLMWLKLLPGLGQLDHLVCYLVTGAIWQQSTGLRVELRKSHRIL